MREGKGKERDERRGDGKEGERIPTHTFTHSERVSV
jgi:hypothetical protein